MKKILVLTLTIINLNLYAQSNPSYEITNINNTQVLDAIKSQCETVLASNNEAQRKEFSLAIVEELKSNRNVMVKKFYLDILKECAKDEVVRPLSTMLGNLKIQDSVIAVLLKIDSPASKAALTKDLSIYDRITAANIIKDARIDGFENQLLSWYYASGRESQRSILDALSYVGSSTSIKVFSKVIRNESYTRRETIDNYLRLLNNTSKKEPELVLKYAKQLFNGGQRARSNKAIIGGAKIMLELDRLNSEKAINKIIHKVSSSTRAELRNLL